MTRRVGSVSIVIPNYQGYRLLEENLPKVILASQNPINKITEIIVVEDASTDESLVLLKRQFPEIKLIIHKKNTGFVTSVNDGVKTAVGEFICLLNTDVIPSPEFLETVLPHFENEKVFGVSLNEEGVGWTWTKGVFKDGYI